MTYTIIYKLQTSYRIINTEKMWELILFFGPTTVYPIMQEWLIPKIIKEIAPTHLLTLKYPGKKLSELHQTTLKKHD